MADVRLIDANALKSLLIEVLERIKESPKMTRDEMHIISGRHMLCEMIDDAHTIDAVPVVHGQWLRENIREKSYLRVCSVCKKIAYFCGEGCSYLYCPNCGAIMDGGAEQ